MNQSSHELDAWGVETDFEGRAEVSSYISVLIHAQQVVLISICDLNASLYFIWGDALFWITCVAERCVSKKQHTESAFDKPLYSQKQFTFLDVKLTLFLWINVQLMLIALHICLILLFLFIL